MKCHSMHFWFTNTTSTHKKPVFGFILHNYGSYGNWNRAYYLNYYVIANLQCSINNWFIVGPISASIGIHLLQKIQHIYTEALYDSLTCIYIFIIKMQCGVWHVLCCLYYVGRAM